MKIYIDEDWDSGGCTFAFSENISENEADNPYIVDIDANKLARWKKILAEKEKIDRKYWAIQSMLCDIKRVRDNELVEVICPGCNKSLAFRRDNLPDYCGPIRCSNCNCHISRDKEDTKYVVHSGEGLAFIDRGYRPTDEDKAEQSIATFQQIEKQGGLKRK